MRVLLVSPLPPPYGGISHWTSTIAEHAAGLERVEVRVVNTSPRNPKRLRNAAASRLRHGLARLPREVAGVLRQVILWKPDAVHLNTSGQLAIARDIVILLLCRGFGVRSIYHIRYGRVPEMAARQTVEWHMMRIALRLSSSAIALDSNTRNAIHNDTDAHCIPNFIDLAKIPRVTAERRREVLYVGWLVPAKGYRELIEAWRRIRPAGWRLVLAGPFDQSTAIELEQLRSSVDFEITGHLSHDDVIKRMLAASIFVLPSHTEGMANVLLEAMACGPAIVSTRVGAAEEMLDREAGLLVNARDPANLGVAISSLIDSPELRHKIASAAHENVAQRYSMDVVFRRYLELWGK